MFRTEPPNCRRCPKLVEQEALGDPRIMEAVYLYRLGIPKTDDIIRSDSWRYAAYGILHHFEALREAEEFKRGMNQKGRS